MMSSSQAATVAVADAVYDLLRASTRTLNPSCSRTYNTDRKLKDSGALHIDVVNAGYKITPLTREAIARDPVVQIVVRKRLANDSRDDDPPELDRLCNLVEEIEDTFALTRVVAADAVWIGCETFGPFDNDYREWRQFTAIVAVTFRVHGD